MLKETPKTPGYKMAKLSLYPVIALMAYWCYGAPLHPLVFPLFLGVTQMIFWYFYRKIAVLEVFVTLIFTPIILLLAMGAIYGAIVTPLYVILLPISIFTGEGLPPINRSTVGAFCCFIIALTCFRDFILHRIKWFFKRK